jgi:hypothetical protein
MPVSHNGIMPISHKGIMPVSIYQQRSLPENLDKSSKIGEKSYSHWKFEDRDYAGQHTQ